MGAWGFYPMPNLKKFLQFPKKVKFFLFPKIATKRIATILLKQNLAMTERRARSATL